jgi:hypothetical protein
MGAGSAEQREARFIASGTGAGFALAAVFGFARTAKFVETNQSDLGSPVPFAKIFRFTRRRANHLYKFAPSRPTQGRIAIVTNAGWGAVDAAASCVRRDRRAGS